MKNKYAVAISWNKQIPTGINIALSLRSDIEAYSKEEALGIAVDTNELKETHSVFKYLVHLLQDNSDYSGD